MNRKLFVLGNLVSSFFIKEGSFETNN